MIRINDVNYGYSLYYSYLLPLFDIKPTEKGFEFKKVIGFCNEIECSFNRKEMTTLCTVSERCLSYSRYVLGIDSGWGFNELCKMYGGGDCIAKNITLLYSPNDAKLVLYAILLSRNTDYFINTLRWFKEFVVSGDIKGGGYIARQFLEIVNHIENIFRDSIDTQKIVPRLLSTPNIGSKTVHALLLHAYGLTEYAPVDRHYAWYLSKIFPGIRSSSIKKNICITYELNCLFCIYRKRCAYGVTKIFGKLNGYIQSLAYLSKRLAISRSWLEEVLVPKDHRHIRELENIVKTAIENIARDALKNARL